MSLSLLAFLRAKKTLTPSKDIISFCRRGFPARSSLSKEEFSKTVAGILWPSRLTACAISWLFFTLRNCKLVNSPIIVGSSRKLLSSRRNSWSVRRDSTPSIWSNLFPLRSKKTSRSKRNMDGGIALKWLSRIDKSVIDGGRAPTVVSSRSLRSSRNIVNRVSISRLCNRCMLHLATFKLFILTKPWTSKGIVLSCGFPDMSKFRSFWTLTGSVSWPQTIAVGLKSWSEVYISVSDAWNRSKNDLHDPRDLKFPFYRHFLTLFGEHFCFLRLLASELCLHFPSPLALHSKGDR